MVWMIGRVRSYLDIEEANTGASVVDLRGNLLSLCEIWVFHVCQVNDGDGVEVSLHNIFGNLYLAETSLKCCGRHDYYR